MNKFLLFSIGGALLVGGVAVSLLVQTDSDEMITAEDSDTKVVLEEETQLPTSGRSTLSDLLSRAVDLECNISHKLDNNSSEEVSGTYFTSNGKMRGDFIVPGAGEDVVSSVIMRDDNLYSWSEINGEKYGVKIDINAVEEKRANGEVPDTNEPVPLDAPVQYDCKAWTNVDGSIFEPPSDVIFKDFSTIINTGMEFGTIYEDSPDKAKQCELCAQVPAGEGRDSCMAAFSCQ